MLDHVGRERGCSFRIESSNAEDITRAAAMRVQQTPQLTIALRLLLLRLSLKICCSGGYRRVAIRGANQSVVRVAHGEPQ